MNKIMRILVLYDLPTKKKEDMRAANKFRNFLLKDGYHMVQLSVYARICNGTDAVATHKARIKQNLPEKGSVRMIVMTEKQYNAIEVLTGNKTFYDKPQENEQLMLF